MKIPSDNLPVKLVQILSVERIFALGPEYLHNLDMVSIMAWAQRTLESFC